MQINFFQIVAIAFSCLQLSVFYLKYTFYFKYYTQHNPWILATWTDPVLFRKKVDISIMHLTAKEILSGFQCLQKTEELQSLKKTLVPYYYR